MKFWCYEDFGHDWGSNLFKAAHDRGHECQLFQNPRLADNGVAFVHMHHHPEVRNMLIRTMETLSTNPELTLVPSYRGSRLFDDKLEQLRQFARFMPHTVVYQTIGRAREHLDAGKQPKLPFVSKSREGTASHNVRTVSTFDLAMGEIKLAFSDRGIKQRHGQVQRSYLMWQRLIPEITCDIRIVRVGERRLAIRRLARGNIAQRLQPIARMDDEIADALWYANAFWKDQRDLEWSAIDLIKDPERGRWYLLEVSVAWTMAGFAEAMFIEGDKVTNRPGTEIWPVLVEEIEKGHFGDIR